MAGLADIFSGYWTQGAVLATTAVAMAMSSLVTYYAVKGGGTDKGTSKGTKVDQVELSGEPSDGRPSGPLIHKDERMSTHKEENRDKNGISLALIEKEQMNILRQRTRSRAASSRNPRRSQSTENPGCVLEHFFHKKTANKRATRANNSRAINYCLRDQIKHEESSHTNAITLLRAMALRRKADTEELSELDAASLLYTISVLQTPQKHIHVPVALQNFAYTEGEGEEEGEDDGAPPTHGPRDMQWLKNTFTPHLPTRQSSHLPLNPQTSRASLMRPCWPLPYECSDAETDAVQDALGRASEWEFDVRVLVEVTNGKPLQVMGWHLLHTVYNYVSMFGFEGATLRRWLAHVEDAYCNTEYHSATHACDVLQTLFFFLRTAGAEEYLNDTQVLALLLGAIVHDLGHDGCNNNFHKNTMSQRALDHNDLSIQESFHISTIFSDTLRNDDINIFKSLAREFTMDLRSALIKLVLATDMSKHFEHKAHFETLVEQRGCDVEGWKAEGASGCIELMCAVLHCADISNPAKPTDLAAYWAGRCLAEFFKQGKLEKNFGLPVSPNCDPETTNLPQSQIGFISVIVLPTYQGLARLLPTVGETCVVQIEANLEHWKSLAPTPKTSPSSSPAK